MDSVVQNTYIVQDEDICDGQPRIAGSRVKVEQVAFEHRCLFHNPAEICQAHPGLTLAQVHAALSYYYDHRQEVDKVMRQSDKYYEFEKRYRQRMGLGPA